MAMGGTAFVNPYGREIKGLTGPPSPAPANYRKGDGSAYDIALRLRAGGKINLGGRRRRGQRASSVRQNPTRNPGQVNDIDPNTGQPRQPAGQPNDFMSLIRNQLAGLGAATPQGQGLPDPRMLADGALSRFETDPVLQAYIEAAYSRMGIDPRTLLATARQYRPTGLNTGGGVPSVRFT